MSTPPHWDLTNIYPSLESKEFKAALSRLKKKLKDLGEYFDKTVAKANAKTPPKRLGKIAGELVDAFNDIYTLSTTLGAYIAFHVDTNSHDKVAKRIESEYEQAVVPLRKLSTRFTAWLGRVRPALKKALPQDSTAKAHAFNLMEAADQSKYLMTEDLEGLAAELTLSGGNAWGKLMGTVTSQLTVDFELDGKMQKLPMTALINLRSHADGEVRRRAYEAENKAWESVQEVLAATLNGVKGEVNTLNKRRGREDALHSAVDMARIDRPTLNAMLAAMKDSFPLFRRYYQHKAKLLGKEKLAWYDLYAPVGRTGGDISYEETRDFIIKNFNNFSPELSTFAKRAFDHNWLDAEMREGKRAGGYCAGVETVKESRIFVNFDGSPDQISTIAHELGHAFHNECAYQQKKTILQQDTPMTLAETASTFCETIVTEARLAKIKDPQEELAILEGHLNGAAQVIVDIYSRFLFEKEVFERREKSELSADDFNDIMQRAQKATYGDGLDENLLQKYMWTWKPHYYSTGISFYNFPYAFGLLFGTGLYAIFKQRGAAFVEDYKNLLASTGEASAADLAARFGIDIRKKKFWADSIAIIARHVDRYCEL
jgi:pepF/M3 family oligoendopeptidase